MPIMKKIILLILLSFTFFHQTIVACTCAFPNTFCEGLSDVDGNIYSDVILRGTITSVDGGLEIQVDELLYGSTNQNLITLGYGFCDVYTDPLEKGNEYIFSLIINSNNKYSLIGCTISYLKIEDEVIKGNIAPGIESLDYADLVTLEGCGDKLDLFSIERSLKVFPNPTGNFLKIKNASSSNSIGTVQLEFFDMIGRELYAFKKEDEFFAGEIWDINLQNFEAGVYYLKLTADTQETVIKIVKL